MIRLLKNTLESYLVLFNKQNVFKEAKILETTQLSWKTKNKCMEQNTVPNHQVFRKTVQIY